MTLCPEAIVGVAFFVGAPLALLLVAAINPHSLRLM